MTKDVYNARNLVVPTSKLYIPDFICYKQLTFFETVDSELKRRIEADIRTAQQDMDMYENSKAEINRGLEEIGEEDKVFKKRSVSRYSWSISCGAQKFLWRML